MAYIVEEDFEPGLDEAPGALLPGSWGHVYRCSECDAHLKGHESECTECGVSFD